jgi:hypothetical protein
MRRAAQLAIGGAVTAWLLGATLAAGQAQPAARAQMAEQVFKNVQVLRGIPVDEFMGTMGFFSASLGLNCTDCHGEESGGSWERYADETDLKRTARQMTLMVQNINRTSFGGRQVVTCSTCHRGNSRPNVMPSLNLLYAEPPPDEPGDPVQQAPGQPSADAILDKFLAALGGPQRLSALTSIAAKGTYRGFDDAEASPLELYANAQGQRTIVAHPPQGDHIWAVDGGAGWIAGPPTDRPVPVMPITGQELEGLKVEIEVFFPSRIKQALRNWRVGPPALLEDGREVRVVQGETPGGGVVTLCFDAESGLLRRLVRFGDSPVGRLVTRVDYSDYRDVLGVRIPSKWTVRWLSGRSEYELTDVQPNVPIAPARFAQPGR